jgi:hypothetical protein
MARTGMILVKIKGKTFLRLPTKYTAAQRKRFPSLPTKPTYFPLNAKQTQLYKKVK